MMEEEIDKMNSNDSMFMNMTNETTFNCSSCENEFCLAPEDYEYYLSFVKVDDFEMVFVILNVIVFLTGIMGNLLVIIAVTTTKSMQSVTNIFIVNLATADMLVMLFCAPPSVIWDVTNTWIFGSLMCRVIGYIQNLSVSVSVLTLTFIAYDRYNAICRPLQFSTRRSKAAVVIGAIWTISSMVGIPDAISLQAQNFHFPKNDPCIQDDILWDLTTCVPTWSESVDFSFTIVKGIVLYTLPLIFMSIGYYFIVKTLWRRNNIPHMDTTDTTSSAQLQLQSTTSSAGSGNASNGTYGNFNKRPTLDDPTASKVTFFRSKTTRAMRFVGRSQSGNQLEEQRTMVTSVNSASKNLDNQLKTRRKVAKMLIAVVIMFSINFFPVHFLPVLNFIVKSIYQPTEEGDPQEDSEQVSYQNWNTFFQKAAIIQHCMCYFNSAINPIIYYFMSAQFKAQYRRIVSCRCTADTPQIDYSRYNAGRGPQPSGVLAATHFRNPKDSHSQFRANTEVMTLRELSAPPLRGMDNQIVVERPMGAETEPFMRSANQTEEKLSEELL